jgi:hypothetical protein
MMQKPTLVFLRCADEFLDQKESRLQFPPVTTALRTQHDNAVRQYKIQFPDPELEEVRRRSQELKQRISDLYTRQRKRLNANQDSYSQFVAQALGHFDAEEHALWKRLKEVDATLESQKEAAAQIDAALLTAEFLSRDATFTSQHHLGPKSSKVLLSNAVFKELVEQIIQGADIGVWIEQETLVHAAGTPDKQSKINFSPLGTRMQVL